jgi:hypothetical protein
LNTTMFHLGFSTLAVITFLGSGIYAIDGPFRTDAPRPWHVEFPAWIGEIVSPGHIPAYYIRPDGSALPVGRANLLLKGLEIKLFPDKGLETEDALAVYILPTDAKAVWALVPPDSKAAVRERAERMARRIQSQFLAMIGKPEFNKGYLTRFKAISTDAFVAAWSDPRIEMLRSVRDDLVNETNARAFVDEVMPIIMPALRNAALEILTPDWEKLRALLLEWRIDAKPLARAAETVMENDKVRASVMKLATGLADNPKAWRIGSFVIDIYLDHLTKDERFEQLARDLLRDPAFSNDLRTVEVEVSDFATTLFKFIAERGDVSVPDTLAIRLMRYVLLKRLSAVAVLAPRDSPRAAALEPYRAVRVENP